MTMRACLLLLGLSLLQPALAHAQAGSKPQPPAPTTSKPAAPAQERKEIKVSEKVLKTYVGDYELTPERILTITLENGSLHGQPSGQEKSQLFAESQTKFFLKSADIQVTFQNDAKGNVAGLLLDQAGRPQRELKKEKYLTSQFNRERHAFLLRTGSG